MKTLHAGGFILARIVDGKPHYLLLRSTRHGGWGFPKGHADPGEDDLATARRETLEETGIGDVAVVEGFAHRSEYDVRSGKRGAYHKVVTYFLGTTGQAAPLLSDEHTEADWLEFATALQRLEFPALREALTQADAHLRKAVSARR